MLRKLPPMHPGEVLREEFLEPLKLTAYGVAKACGIPRTRVERIVREEVGITADTALRFSRFFKTTPDFWLNLQKDYDLQVAKKSVERQLAKIEPHETAA